MKRSVDIPTQHQIKIAKSILKINDVMATTMGGMTKKEAKEILEKYEEEA